MNKFNLLVHNFGDMDNIPSGDIAAEPFLYSIDNSVLTSTSSPFLGHALKIDYPLMSSECVPQLLGSSNGLVCIRPISEDICIWNPATREYKHIPDPSPHSNPFLIAHGFGFDCKNDDYKVLRIACFDFDYKISEARVYSLASNSWKNLGFIPYDFSYGINKGLLLNGVLHWTAIAHRNGLKSNVVVSYDISDETFHHVPLPNKISKEDGYRSISDLGVLEGKLCLLRMNDQIDVWIMIDNKWSKHLKITAHMYFGHPIQTLQNGEILFDGGGNGLRSYDPNLERARDLKIHDFPDDALVEAYIETLVALNSGAYVGQ